MKFALHYSSLLVDYNYRLTNLVYIPSIDSTTLPSDIMISATISALFTADKNCPPSLRESMASYKS